MASISGSGSTNNLLQSLNRNNQSQNKALERLASGRRINRAADDAAGLAISDALNAEARVRTKAIENADFATSLTNIADGAASQITDITARLSELATQAANGTLSDDQRAALNTEFQELSQEAQRIVSTTEFNGVNVFSGQSTTIQVGTDSSANSAITLQNGDLQSTVNALASLDIGNQAGAQAAIESVAQARNEVSQARGQIGASAVRVEVSQNNNRVARENALAAESRIRDADTAEETANLVAARIRTNINSAVLAQANQDRGNVLRLLGS